MPFVRLSDYDRTIRSGAVSAEKIKDKSLYINR